jgi:hypothetical protein
MNFENDLFISYQWDRKHLIHKIVNYLKIYDFNIWIDTNGVKPGFALHERIQNGVNKSEIIFAFVTMEYCKSQSCQQEIQYAKRIKKKILFVVLEKFNIAELPNGMGVFLSSKCC